MLGCYIEFNFVPRWDNWMAQFFMEHLSDLADGAMPGFQSSEGFTNNTEEQRSYSRDTYLWLHFALVHIVGFRVSYDEYPHSSTTSANDQHCPSRPLLYSHLNTKTLLNGVINNLPCMEIHLPSPTGCWCRNTRPHHLGPRLTIAGSVRCRKGGVLIGKGSKPDQTSRRTVLFRCSEDVGDFPGM